MKLESISFQKQNLFLQPSFNRDYINNSIFNGFRYPFEAYDKGGSIIKIFISPVESVIIGVALYEQFQILKRNWFPILVSTVLGSTFSIIIYIY